MSAAAFLDVDGTIVRGDIVRYFVRLRTRAMGPVARALWIAAYLPQVARWIVLDRIDRERMNRAFYRGYRGLDAAVLARAAEQGYRELVGRRVFPALRQRIDRHRRDGLSIVLVTGSLDFLVAPLARDVGADHVLAVSMRAEGGVLTGELVTPPLAGTAKAEAVRAHAARHGFDLARSWAYGDAPADVPMLEAVGHAVAVNPGRRLAALARARGWEVLRAAA